MVNHVTCDDFQFDKEHFERSNGPLCRGCVLVLHCYRPMVSPWAWRMCMCSVGRAKLWRSCPAFLQPQRLESKIEGAEKKKNKLWQIIIDNYSVLTDLKEGEFYHYFIIKSDNFPRLAAKLWFPCCLGRFSLWPLPPLGEEPSQWRLVMHCEGLGIQFPTACIPKAMTFR